LGLDIEEPHDPPAATSDLFPEFYPAGEFTDFLLGDYEDYMDQVDDVALESLIGK
jgi:hypothetical protein